jgi:serine/threonine protein kinase
VFLVRSPARVAQRAACLRTIKATSDRDKGADFADAIWSFSRADSVSELGAMKVFKIRDEGGEQQAVERLKQEFQVLKENRPGLPKLLDSNESERWLVTEFFPTGTLEDNILHYRGKPDLALKAFLTLVNTVAQLHDEGIVHRDIKPANVFVRSNDELVLGDFGIVFLPDQPARLTRTNESVGPHDYMPPWADLGGRLDEVDPNFDVYMLGKLLWCMVAGRLILRREWFREPQNDVSLMFRDDPHAYMINTILDKCVVDRPEQCHGIHDLRAMVIAFVSLIEQGGQLLRSEVPRPCHVCGHGRYRPVRLKESDSVGEIRVWTGGSDTVRLSVQTFTCDSCGHVEFFKSG